MQQSTMPVGSVAQTLPMAGMPQTISMVQQIHPVSTFIDILYNIIIFLFLNFYATILSPFIIIIYQFIFYISNCTSPVILRLKILRTLKKLQLF